MPRARKVRTRFTAEDDEILLDWVDRIRARGLPLWSVNQWQELADKVNFSKVEQSNVNTNSTRATVLNRGEDVIKITLDTFGQIKLRSPNQ